MDRQQAAVGARLSTPPLRLAFAASAAGLAQAKSEIEAFLCGSGLARPVLSRLLLLVEEAVMNVAMHGHDEPGEHAVALVLDVLPQALVLRLEDDGRPFDPRTAPVPARPTSLDEARPGGLGVHLMRSLASSLSYERRDGRNVLTLQVDRS